MSKPYYWDIQWSGERDQVDEYDGWDEPEKEEDDEQTEDGEI